MSLFSWLLSGSASGDGENQTINSKLSTRSETTKTTNKHIDTIQFDTDTIKSSNKSSSSSSRNQNQRNKRVNRNNDKNVLEKFDHLVVESEEDDRIIKQLVSANTPLEIVFSFDTTGRMFRFFERVKSNQFKDTLQSLFEMIPLLRISIIAHGDYCDDNIETSNPFKRAITILPFTNDLKEILNWISKVEKTDGGDAPELYEYILRKTRELPWSSNSRKAIVLFGDDVPHPPSYTDQHLYWRNEIHFLTKIGVKVYGIQCLNNMHSQLFYEELACLSGGRYCHLNEPKDVDHLLTLICLRESSQTQLDNYLKEHKSIKKNKTFAQIHSDAFVRERETLNVRFSWWDISNDTDPNPKFFWNDQTNHFEANITNFIPPKPLSPNKTTLTSSTSTTSSSTPSLYLSQTRQQPQQQQQFAKQHINPTLPHLFLFDTTPLHHPSYTESIYTPVSTPMTPYGIYNNRNRNNYIQQQQQQQPLFTPMSKSSPLTAISPIAASSSISNNSTTRQVKIGVVASPKNKLSPTTTNNRSSTSPAASSSTQNNGSTKTSRKRKSFESEEDDENNSSYSTPSSDETVSRDLFGRLNNKSATFTATTDLNQQGSLLNHQHKKDLLFLEKPPKPKQQQQQYQQNQQIHSLVSPQDSANTSPGGTTTAAVTSTTTTSTTTTTSLFTVNNQLPQQQQHIQNITNGNTQKLKSSNNTVGAMITPPRVGNFVALKTATGNDFVVGKIESYIFEDKDEIKRKQPKSVNVIRYQCIEDDDDRYYIESRKQIYPIESILGSVNMKSDPNTQNQQQYRLVLPTATLKA